MAGLTDLMLLSPELAGDQGDAGEDDNDPRRKLMSLMGAKAAVSLGQGNQNDTGTGTGTGTGAGQGSGAGGDTGAPLIQGAEARLGATPDPGIPTSFPASAGRAQASDRLQRANSYFEPGGMKRDLLRAALQAAPLALGARGGDAMRGAAQGAEQGQELAYNRARQTQGVAQSQYGQQAALEEQQRQDAIREKVAMSQIEANKAYRLLMGSVANRRNDINQDKNTVTAAAKGLTVVQGPDGTRKVVSIPADQLGAIQQAQLGVDQAKAELDKAQTANLPEMIKVRQRALDIQNQMLQKSLAQLQLNVTAQDRQNREFGINNYGVDPDTGAPPPGQPMQNGAPVGLRQNSQTGPTNTMRGMADMAKSVEPMQQALVPQIQALAQKIGPAAGRWNNFWVKGVGANDPDYAKADQSLTMYASAVVRTHFGARGGQGYIQILMHDFHQAQSADDLLARIQGAGAWIEGYANSGAHGAPTTGGNAGAAVAGPGGGAANRLKRIQPGGTDGTTGGGRSLRPSTSPTPPPGARIRDFTQVSQ